MCPLDYLSQILDFSDELLEVGAGFQSTRGWTLVDANLRVIAWRGKCTCLQCQDSGSLHFPLEPQTWQRDLHSYWAGERARVVHCAESRCWDHRNLVRTHFCINMLYDEGKVGLPLADSLSSFITLGKSGHVRGLLGGLSDRTGVKNLSQCLE